eukprot:4229430-Prorocentrum_lima.AAC.1
MDSASRADNGLTARCSRSQEVSGRGSKPKKPTTLGRLAAATRASSVSTLSPRWVSVPRIATSGSMPRSKGRLPS